MNDLRADLGIVNSFQGIKKRRAPKKIDGIGQASDSNISDNEDDQKVVFQIESQEYDFWQRRSKDARQWALLINTSNLYYQLTAIMNPLSNRHLTANIIYSVNSVLIWTLLVQTFLNEDWLQRNMEVVLISTFIRNIIRIWDFEDSKDDMTPEELKEFMALIVL